MSDYVRKYPNRRPYLPIFTEVKPNADTGLFDVILRFSDFTTFEEADDFAKDLAGKMDDSKGNS